MLLLFYNDFSSVVRRLIRDRRESKLNLSLTREEEEEVDANCGSSDIYLYCFPVVLKSRELKETWSV